MFGWLRRKRPKMVEHEVVDFSIFPGPVFLSTWDNEPVEVWPGKEEFDGD